MKQYILLALMAYICMPLSGLAAEDAFVLNGNNDGTGSLRAALVSGATRIIIQDSVSTITIKETLKYKAKAALYIVGSGQTIDATKLHSDILVLTQGADLSVTNLSLVGPGGYSFSNQGGGKGIYVDVPNTRTGVVRVVLNNVSVRNTGNHGIHISDCTIGDDCGSGSGGSGNGSPASIDVQLTSVTVDGVGFGKADADGVRVDERADGDIIFSATNSTFVNVGADGVELDEGNNGNVILDVSNTSFSGNGAFCLGNDPLTIDGPCDDGGKLDVDDGFDIDEAGAGSITGKVNNLIVSKNYDEGLDFDEQDAGGFNLEIIAVRAFENEDEGIKISEENDGSVVVNMNNVDIQNNNGSKEDVEIEEVDNGDVSITVTGSYIDELKATESGAGKGTIKVRASTIVENLNLKKIKEL